MESKFRFLTKHSLLKKIKNKWFVIVNIIVALIIIGLVNVDSIVKLFGGDFDNELKIMIVDNAGYYDEIKNKLVNVKEYISDSDLIIKKEENTNKIKKKIKDTKDILLVINKDDDNIFNVEFITDSYVDAIKYQSIVTCLNSAKSEIALKNSNIAQEQLAKINSSVEIKRTFISDEKNEDEESSRTLLSTLALIVVLPCFMLIMFLVQMIGAEINEEKSTRGMEIIIGNVSPKVHFFSKILSSNLFVIFQCLLFLLYGSVGLIIRKLTTQSSKGVINEMASTLDLSEVVKMVENGGILDKLSYVIPLVIILILLSFLAYSLLSGILASMTTNMENYQQLQTPLMIISIIGYYLILVSAFFPGATFIKVASVIPLISISLAPSLLLSGEIGVGLVIVAILLLALLDYVLIKYGICIYKVGILNYSESNLWKKMFKAIKQK